MNFVLRTGLEPVISTLKGWCPNLLDDRSIFLCFRQESNPCKTDLEAAASSTQPRKHFDVIEQGDIRPCESHFTSCRFLNNLPSLSTATAVILLAKSGSLKNEWSIPNTSSLCFHFSTSAYRYIRYWFFHPSLCSIIY